MTHLKRIALFMAMLLIAAACGNGNGAGEGADPVDDAATDAADVDEGQDVDGDEGTADDFADAPTVTFQMSYPFPGGHHIQEEILDPWIEEVRERTNGTVNFEVHPGASLADPAEHYDLAAGGAIDAAWSVQAYSPGQFPLTEGLSLPFLFTSSESATEVLWDLYDEFPELQDEYGDAKLLALWTSDQGDLLLSDATVTELPDMSGLTVRVAGEIQNDLLNEFGGTPVSMPAGEVYDAVDRGVIDGVLIANSGLESLSLHEVITDATVAGFYFLPLFLVMNQGAYDELTPAQQEVIDEQAGRELSLELARNYDENTLDAADMEEYGISVVELEQEERERWREQSTPVAEAWQSRVGGPATEMYERMLESGR